MNLIVTQMKWSPKEKGNSRRDHPPPKPVPEDSTLKCQPRTCSVLSYEEKLDVVPRLSDFFLNFITFLKYFLENILVDCHSGQLRVAESIISILSYILWLFFIPWNTKIFLFSLSFLNCSFLPKSNHVLSGHFLFPHSKIFLFSNRTKNKIVMKLSVHFKLLLPQKKKQFQYLKYF